MTVPTLAGERVTLRAFRDADRAARQRHGWHREIERGYGADTPTRAMTDEEAEAWLGYLAARTAAGAMGWAVESGGELAGAAFLLDLREGDRKARLALGMYAPQFLGRGLGTEAIRLVLRHAFGTLQMHRVDLKVPASTSAPSPPTGPAGSWWRAASGRAAGSTGSGTTTWSWGCSTASSPRSTPPVADLGRWPRA